MMMIIVRLIKVPFMKLKRTDKSWN